MIFRRMRDKKIQDLKTESQEREATQNIKKYLLSSSLGKLSLADAQKLAVDYELIHCAEYLDIEKPLDQLFLKKLYMLLFQLAWHMHFQSLMRNFLKRYDFYEIIGSHLGKKTDSADKIIFFKISRFLNCFKETQVSLKTLSHSLIMEYHEYRLIDRFKKISEFVRLGCELIGNFVSISHCSLFVQLKHIQWRELGGQKFLQFYNEFADLCQFEKRVRYINCSLIEFEILNSLSLEDITQIEATYKQILKQNKNKTLINEEIVPQIAKSSPPKNVVSVKKNIKGMNRAIRAIIKKSTEDKQTAEDKQND